MNDLDVKTMSMGLLVSTRCSLETKTLSPAKHERLSRRRFRKKAAARRLEQDLLARALLPIIETEITRRHERPIDNIDNLSVERLLEIRAQATPYILDHMGQVRAMMSTLGTFDGDIALENDEKARCYVRQIDRELAGRRTAA